METVLGIEIQPIVVKEYHAATEKYGKFESLNDVLKTLKKQVEDFEKSIVLEEGFFAVGNPDKELAQIAVVALRALSRT